MHWRYEDLMALTLDEYAVLLDWLHEQFQDR